MGYKVNTNTDEVNQELMNRLAEYGLSIELPEDDDEEEVNEDNEEDD